MRANTDQLELATGFCWDVHAFAYPFGVGKRLGRVHAVTRVEAEQRATAAHGSQIIVTPHCGRAPDRDGVGRQRHAGNSWRPR